jgi:NADPH2 dehydrogenase
MGGIIMKDILAQPIQIGSIQAKNRILMPPMYRPWSDTSGKVSDRHITHYRERAEGGVGTIVVETTAVLREYRLSQSNIGIWSDEHVDGLSKVAEVICKNNVLAFIQINHTAVNRALSSEEIITARNAFADAVVRGVELHAAHGFLLSQLLSSKHNQQSDKYGGSIDGRMRLLMEIIPLAREKTKPDFILGVREDRYSGRWNKNCSETFAVS